MVVLAIGAVTYMKGMFGIPEGSPWLMLIGLGFGDPLPPLATYPGLVLIVGATFILQRTK